MANCPSSISHQQSEGTFITLGSLGLVTSEGQNVQTNRMCIKNFKHSSSINTNKNMPSSPKPSTSSRDHPVPPCQPWHANDLGNLCISDVVSDNFRELWEMPRVPFLGPWRCHGIGQGAEPPQGLAKYGVVACSSNQPFHVESVTFRGDHLNQQ